MKNKSPKSTVKPKPKTVPPPDDPLLRHDQDESLDDRDAAEKRLEAIQKIRKTKP